MSNGMQLFQGRVIRRSDSMDANEAPPIVQFGSSPACGVPMALDARSGLVGIPSDVAQYVCWAMRGIRRSPRTGKITSVALTTPEVILPVAGSFQVGPDLSPAQALGKFLPYEWETEAIGRGVFRIKVDFFARKIAGALITTAEIVKSAKSLEFRILQIGTEDRWDVALNVGDAQDASKSLISPSEGGYYLPDGEEVIPYNPTTFAFDFAGTLAGGPGDQYAIRAVIRSYFRAVGC